jgi:peptidoglycan/xylan/chitin deacetylase (PgdA/CDA1 family)
VAGAEVLERGVGLLHRHTPVSALVSSPGDVVLMYHAVGRPWREPHSLPRETFERQAAILARDHEVVPLGDLAEPDAGRPRVAMTFDDGYHDFHDIVVPVLREYDLPATVFVPPAFLGDENPDLARERFGVLEALPPDERALMTRDELREVAESDLVTVGNHTLTHPDLSGLAREELEREVEAGREELADLLGRSVNLFSYPYGGYDDETFGRLRSVVGRSHDLAVTSRWGHVAPEPDRLLLLDRVEAPVDGSLFETRLAPAYGRAIDVYRWLA